MTGNCHVRCGAGEKTAIISKSYLSLFGKIPDFEKLLATMRKFEISATIILQNLAQIKEMYEKKWEVLTGNCDTMIYLGGKEQSTNEYVSKELGKETIDTVTQNKTKSKQGSTSYNDGILGRELLTVDELSKMDNSECIVLIRAMNPFKTLKFVLENHYRYNELDECDKENNTFDVNNFFTEIELGEMEFIDDNYIQNKNLDKQFDNEYEINVILGGNSEEKVSLPKTISEETNEMIEKITGIYSKTLSS